jgi:hypothetical protein
LVAASMLMTGETVDGISAATVVDDCFNRVTQR